MGALQKPGDSLLRPGGPQLRLGTPMDPLWTDATDAVAVAVQCVWLVVFSDIIFQSVFIAARHS